MAIAIYTSPISQLSGKLGSIVFSKARGKFTARRLTRPTTTPSLKQLPKRRSLAYHAHRFRTALEPYQQAAWDAYALTCPFTDSLGNEYYLSGISMFIRNSILYNTYAAAEPPLDPLPAPSASGFPTELELEFYLDTYDNTLYLSTANPPEAFPISAGFLFFKPRPATQRYNPRIALTLMGIELSGTTPQPINNFIPPDNLSSGQWAVQFSLYIFDSFLRFSRPYKFFVVAS